MINRWGILLGDKVLAKPVLGDESLDDEVLGDGSWGDRVKCWR